MSTFTHRSKSGHRPAARRPSAPAIAGAGAVSLAVAMGIGRFAFTPLLPMMLHDGTVDLGFGGQLASANYLGYLAGAMLCMGLPRIWPGAAIIRASLAATVLLTAAMALPLPFLWLPLRFLAGAVSAVAFVYTSGWCLAELAELGSPALGSAIFTGPGAGIALSGLAATGMVALDWRAPSGWLLFGLIAILSSALVWRVFQGRDPTRHRGTAPAAPAAPRVADEHPMEMIVFAIAYGLAGFGYIITATFLPVIARNALPGSPWLDLFWPIFGFAAVAGSLVAAQSRITLDPRLVSTAAYLCQAAGVALTLVLPTVTGFVVSSLLAGLPFTAISFFAMQEVRRLRPHHAARFMGLLTTLYSIGQIAGPPLVARCLAWSGGVKDGFSLALGIASGALATGAVLHLVMIRLWPIRSERSGAMPDAS